MKRKRLLWGILILAVLVAGGAFYFRNGEEKIPLKTVRVERGTLQIASAASGRVEADIQVDVKSRASGEVVELAVQAGDAVKKGDLLVKLDPVDEERRVSDAEAQAVTARSRLGQAKASLASARANLLEQKGRFERRDAAYRAGLISADEREAAKTSAEVSEASLEQAKASVSSAEADLSRSVLTIEEARKRLDETIIRAPVSGTVLSVAVERGSIVSSGITNVGGGTALLTIADLSNLFVLVKLDEAEIGAVKPEQDVAIRVDAFPNRVFTGRVERVTPLGVSEANIVTFDVKVRITDRSAHLLLPGMSTDVEITTAIFENELLLPTAALKRDTSPREENGRSGIESKPADSQREATPVNGRGPDTQVSAEFRRGDGRRRRDREASSPAGDSRVLEPERSPSESGREMVGRAARTGHAIVTLASGEVRKVRTGATDGMNTVIKEGLREGDEVIFDSGGSQEGNSQRSSNPFAPRGGRARR